MAAAMRGVTIRWEGMDELEAVLRRRTGAAAAKMDKRVAVGAVNIHRMARENLQRNKSVDFGDLIRSLRVRPTGESAWDVYSDAAHAAFVEFGTGPTGAASAHPPLPANYRHGAAWVIATRRGPVTHTGGRAKPYLFPAWERERGRLMTDLRAILKSEVGR